MKISPNIILIVLDTAAAKHMSLYGYHRKTTPELERIAEESIVYTKCFAPATWTVPSHTSLFTGLYPTEHGAFYHTKRYLYPFFYTFADILQSKDYNICGFSANSFISSSMGYARNFNIFENQKPYYGEDVERAKDFFRGRILWSKVLRVPLYLLKGGNPNTLVKAIISSELITPTGRNATPSTKKALKFLRKTIRASREPYFIFVNIIQPHQIYNPPEPFRYRFIENNSELEKRFKKLNAYIHYYAGKMTFSENDIHYLTGLYDAEILFTDFAIGEFYRKLKSSKNFDNTLLIITSDHGEQLGEKGRMGHAHSVYNNLIHIPMVIKYPKWIGLKGINHDLTQLNDLYATIGELTHSDFPVPESSVSLLSSKRKYAMSQYFIDEDLVRQRLMKINAAFDWEKFPYRFSSTAYIRDDLWKIIIGSDGRKELYDLKNDFYENNDLSSDRRYEYILKDITEEASKEINRINGEILLK